LKVLQVAARMETEHWADPGDVKLCNLRSRRRSGWCETSARLLW